MAIPVFPAAILFEDLCKTHAEYDPKDLLTGVPVLRKNRDLYEGGSRFRENIKSYLIARQIEEPSNGVKSLQAVPDGVNPMYDPANVLPTPVAPASAGKAGSDQFSRRCKRSAYAPIGSGMIDFMKAAIFQEELWLQKSDKEKDAYWDKLNVDADGRGNSLDSVGQDFLLGGLIDFRSYLLINDPSPKQYAEGEERSPIQKERGELDSKISYLGAKDVGDWGCDERGVLEWVRVDRRCLKRSQPWLQPDKEERCWIYVTAECFYQYEVEWFIKDGPPNEKTPIALSVGSGNPHGLTYNGQPTMPVIQLPLQRGLHLMDRLSEIILGIFNRQSAATWSLDQMAFAIFCVMTSKTNLGDMVIPEISGLKLEVGDTADFKAPEVAIHAAQLADVERLVQELSLVIQAMVLVAAAKDDQGRKSGIAKKLDFSALTTLLSAYAAPVRKSVERAVQIIKEHRDEQGMDIAVEGLKNFSVQSIESMIANATGILAIQDLPEAARRWTLRGLALKATDDAPEDIRKQVIQQAATAPLTPTMQTMQVQQIKNEVKAGAVVNNAD